MRLTKLELREIEKELEMLEHITVTFDHVSDDLDVLDRCQARTQELMAILEKSYRLARIAESGLRVVGGES